MNETKEHSFVDYIIRVASLNKGVAAALSRADNEAMEYQSWEYLAQFGIDLEKKYLRQAYSLVAAAVAKAKIRKNGTIGIGQALSVSYDEGYQSDQAKAKLRRLLACDSVEELCAILRPLLRLICTKEKAELDYASLLRDLSIFYFSEERIRAKWAQDFYGRRNGEELL